jgi:hypothetical protein
MIAALWPHTSFFAGKLPFPGLLEHTPSFAQPLAAVLALRTAAEATNHRATTSDQAGAPLAVHFASRTVASGVPAG